MKEIHVCVGSLNPTKKDATKKAFLKFFRNISIDHVEADSGVSDQPIGRKNIIKGATNRAKQAMDFLIYKKKLHSHIFGVGIEAGLVEVPEARSGYMDFQFCVIITEERKIYLGSGIGFEYPPFVIDKILKNPSMEIGDIMGNLANNEDLKRETGAIGFLSNNVINRTDILTEAVICALLPIMRPKIYSKKDF
ncbi:MAG: inosine/xanthosine triphosphatase [Promethearchaeia archaeon]